MQGVIVLVIRRLAVSHLAERISRCSLATTVCCSVLSV